MLLCAPLCWKNGNSLRKTFYSFLLFFVSQSISYHFLFACLRMCNFFWYHHHSLTLSYTNILTAIDLSQKIFFGFIFFFLTWQVLSPGSNKKDEKLFTFNFLKEKEQQLFFHFVRKMNNLSANKNVLLFSVLHI